MVSTSPFERTPRQQGGPVPGTAAGFPENALLDYEHAKRTVLATSAAGKDPVDVCLRLAGVASEAGRLEEAVDALKAAIKIDPRCGEAYVALAMIHQKRQDHPQAVDMYLKCLELDGDDLIALLGLFQTCCKMGTFAIIIRYLEIYLGGHPRDVAVLFCLATLYARDGELQKARRALHMILTLEPGKTEAAHLLSQVEAALARGATS